MYLRYLLLVISLIITPTISWSQIVICNHAAVYDKETDVWLATIPEIHFGQNDTLVVNGNKQAFLNICADSIYTITETDQNGRPLSDVSGKEKKVRIQFTFLPIITLRGDFGYDYKEATVTISDPDTPKDTTYTANIKWRGGSTNTENKHKRNYKIKFNNDVQLFGMRSDNNWMLDAGQADVFRMRNRIAMDLWNSMARQPYYAEQEPKALNGVRGEIVEVFLNDEWRGIYNLSEFIDRKQMKLKKVDKQTNKIRGCLYKGVNWNNTKMFGTITSYDNTKDVCYGFELKYPELGEDCDTVDWAPLVKAINFAINSSNVDFAQHVDNYFDMPVIIDYNIFFNVVNAVDNVGKNMYWAVYDKTQSQRITPTPWDLDATFGQRWGDYLIKETVEGYYNSPEFKLDFELMLTYRMFRDNFNNYNDKLNERYKYLRQPGQPLHTDSILSLVTHYYNKVKKSGAANRETLKWNGDSDVWGDVIDFNAEYKYICDWIRKRMDFIDKREFPLYYTQSYFDKLNIQIPTQNKSDYSDIHDLFGRTLKTTKNLKTGIYIRNGKKIVIRR